METLVKADVFFFVTTFAVAIIAVCVGIVTYYIVKILKDIKHISETLNRESEKVVEDIESVRAALKEKGNRIGAMMSTITRTWKRRRNRRSEDFTS